MTLEEAIKHCKEVALSCTNKECALEHFQLLKWLQEYSNMLEKQGEQKYVVIIPKFRIGDEINTSNEESLTITKIDENGYWSKDLFICDFGDAAKWKLVEQKLAWSGEDERMYRGLHNLIYSTPYCDSRKELSDWLKSLKERVQPQPKQEWSEEDVRNIQAIDSVLFYDRNLPEDICMRLRNWLESFRPKSTWKPTEGQLECLGYAIEKAEKDWSPLTNNRIYLTLKALKEQLLELRGSKV